jgi:hypothetical protein
MSKAAKKPRRLPPIAARVFSCAAPQCYRFPGNARQGSTLPINKAAQQGFEHPASTAGKTAKTKSRDAESDALDPHLARIVAAWPTLPEPIRRAMLALVG